MSAFAEYVEEQQRLRRPPASGPTGKTKDHPLVEHHSELDFLDTLNLADSAPQAPLKVLLLDDSSNAKETQKQLRERLHRRIEEGHGETLFELGVEDNGESMGLSPTEWSTAWTRIQAAATELTADCRILISRNTGRADDVDAAGVDDHGHPSSVATVMIRRRPPTVAEVIELRIAVVGNGTSTTIPSRGDASRSSSVAAVDAGKSTMLGVLVKGNLDDGRGKARVNLFRHKHEIESGRTSSVGMEIMGFDSHGDVVSSAVAGRKLSWEEIGTRSVRNEAVIDPCPIVR